jgi:hypothetical protein
VWHELALCRASDCCVDHSMSHLDEIQREWLELFFRLKDIHGDRIAAPFLSVPPAKYDPASAPSVLYVGQATAGEWYRDEFCESPTVDERRTRTTRFLEECVKTGCYRTAFWRFALNLSARFAEIASGAIEPLQNIVWTNISKIGVCSGNPRGACLKSQRELSIRTLRFEIKEYRPALIVFVTGNYGKDVVGEIISDPDETRWMWECKNDWFWWRPSMDELPPVLWTGHPRSKSREEIQRWLEKASVITIHNKSRQSSPASRCDANNR